MTKQLKDLNMNLKTLSIILLVSFVLNIYLIFNNTPTSDVFNRQKVEVLDGELLKVKYQYELSKLSAKTRDIRYKAQIDSLREIKQEIIIKKEKEDAKIKSFPNNSSRYFYVDSVLRRAGIRK